MADDHSIQYRRMDYADSLTQQVNRCLWLKSTRQWDDYGEAVEALFDAIPAEDRDKKFQREWRDRPQAALSVLREDGTVEWVPMPTPSDHSEAFRILMGLLRRRGLLGTRRLEGWAPGPKEASNGSKNQKTPSGGPSSSPDSSLPVPSS